MSDNNELLKRINELAHKAKESSLTEEEIAERAKLRKEYLKNFREGFKSQIEMLQIYDKDNNEVTSEKVIEIQRKKGLRDN